MQVKLIVCRTWKSCSVQFSQLHQLKFQHLCISTSNLKSHAEGHQVSILIIATKGITITKLVLEWNSEIQDKIGVLG